MCISMTRIKYLRIAVKAHGASEKPLGAAARMLRYRRELACSSRGNRHHASMRAALARNRRRVS